jgi:hypothetical protein
MIGKTKGAEVITSAPLLTIHSLKGDCLFNLHYFKSTRTGPGSFFTGGIVFKNL